MPRRDRPTSLWGVHHTPSGIACKVVKNPRMVNQVFYILITRGFNPLRSPNSQHPTIPELCYSLDSMKPLKLTNKITRIFIFFVFFLGVSLTSCQTDNPNIVIETETIQPESTDLPYEEGNQESPTPTSDPNLPDLSGEIITIYMIGDTSEPFTSITESFRDGATDYVSFLNSNGGIFGANVELEFADTGGSQQGAITAYERFASEDNNIVLGIVYSGYGQDFAEQVNLDQIPILVLGIDPNIPEPDPESYIFRLTPSYPEQFAFFLDFVITHWGEIKPGGALDNIKVAYLSWENEYGLSALTDETRAYAESLGIEIVLEESFPMEARTSPTAAIFNAQTAGATIIYTNTHSFGPAGLLNDLNNLAINGFFIVGGNSWGLDAETFIYLANPNFADGFYAPSWYASWSDEENPSIQLAEEIFQANGRTEEEKNTGLLLGMGFLDLAVEAIEQTILEEGYENLTGKNIYNFLSQLSGYPVMSGLFPVDFTDGQRSPSKLQIRQVQGDPGNIITVEEFKPIPDLIIPE